ncbi:hypothetical protein K3495_g3463 [Podosphaera aphanis]|nr:hypothetical protein K3495_g3463 [Podosphaera aphanis]
MLKPKSSNFPFHLGKLASIFAGTKNDAGIDAENDDPNEFDVDLDVVYWFLDDWAILSSRIRSSS